MIPLSILAMPTAAIDLAVAGEDTVFAPFLLRFRPFIARGDNRKIPV
jgi:hypothetical protein